MPELIAVAETMIEAYWLVYLENMMGMTDPIADMLTRIRNANMVKNEKVVMPSSIMKRRIADILVQEGYLASYDEIFVDGKSCIELKLKYSPSGERVFRGLKRVSKPGCRVYTPVGGIPAVLGGLGICILSTSQGLMTGSQAKSVNVGGELLCSVW